MSYTDGMSRRIAYWIVLAITLIALLAMGRSEIRREVSGYGGIVIPLAVMFLLIYLGTKWSPDRN